MTRPARTPRSPRARAGLGRILTARRSGILARAHWLRCTLTNLRCPGADDGVTPFRERCEAVPYWDAPVAPGCPNNETLGPELEKSQCYEAASSARAAPDGASGRHPRFGRRAGRSEGPMTNAERGRLRAGRTR